MSNDAEKRTVLTIACLGSFLPPFMGSSINLALPVIGKEFQLDAIMLSWVAIVYLLSSAMFLLPFGRAGDIYGRKKIYTIGIAIYTFGSLLCGLAFSTPSLIVFRIIQGLGSSMVFGTSVAILTSVFPPQERGRALGINVACVYMGLSLGPFVGGLLTHYLGWRSIFFFNIPFGILVLYMVKTRLEGEWAEAKGEKIDYIGSLLYGVALVMIMYGLARLQTGLGQILAAVGAAAAVAFFIFETKQEHPVLNVKLFTHNIVFALSNLAAFIHYSATFSVTFLMALYLHYIKGLSPQQAGLVLVAQPVMMALFSPLAGRLSDRIEPRLVSSAGMAITCVTLFVLAFIGPDTSLAYIVGVFIIMGFGYAQFSSPNVNAIMGSVERRFLGMASGTMGTMRTVGMTLSMGIVMMIFSIFIGKVQITPEVHPQFMASLRVALIISGFLCFLGIFASLARGTVHNND